MSGCSDLLDCFVGDVPQPRHHVSIRPLVVPRHVEMVILYLVLVRQELVEIVDTRPELFTKKRLMLSPLSLLDQVNHNDRTSIAGQQLVEVSSS